MDTQTTQATPVRAAGVTEGWLAGLETPGGINGGHAAVKVEEDAPDGDGEQVVTGYTGIDTCDIGVLMEAAPIEGAVKPILKTAIHVVARDVANFDDAGAIISSAAVAEVVPRQAAVLGQLVRQRPKVVKVVSAMRCLTKTGSDNPQSFWKSINPKDLT